MSGSNAAPVRFAMIGGGNGAFIGPAHRTAAAIAGNCRLVAGAFSRDPRTARASGLALGLAPARSHAGWQDLITAESRLPADKRAQFVAIVAPNNVHAPSAIASLEAGFPVLCEKPLADTCEAAAAMLAAAKRSGLPFGVTHPYIAYPMAVQARRMIADGALGDIRRVAVRYIQGWLADSADEAGKQAQWRIDPAQSGLAGAFGDIGTHAFNLVETLTGEQIVSLSADLRSVLPGRTLDDDGAALLRLSGGGSGTLVVSQVCAGEANGLAIEIWGSRASLHWDQQDPNRLRVARNGGPREVWDAGLDKDYLQDDALRMLRLPAGHPEGFLEAFANIYRDFAATVVGMPPQSPAFASGEAGVRALAFVEAALASTRDGGAWTTIG
jgi:predicted dehydrogenase